MRDDNAYTDHELSTENLSEKKKKKIPKNSKQIHSK